MLPDEKTEAQGDKVNCLKSRSLPKGDVKMESRPPAS